MIALAWFASAALAEEPPPPPPTKPPGQDTHYFEMSMTAGPVLADTLPGVDATGVVPFAEAYFEKRQGDKVGIGLVAGGGTIDSVPAWEVGINGRGYPLGDFAGGLVIGAEGVFMHKSARAALDPVSGISFGPVIGVKYVLPFGLTIEATGGAAVMFFGPGFDRIQQSFGPIANFGLGWSL